MFKKAEREKHMLEASSSTALKWPRKYVQLTVIEVLLLILYELIIIWIFLDMDVLFIYFKWLVFRLIVSDAYSWYCQCVKRVRIRSYSSPHFPRIFPHSDWIRRVSLRIQSECGKIRTRKNSVFGHFSRSECNNK